MKQNAILKRSIDAAMYVLFLLLMGQYALRGAAHEWLGIAVGVLFVGHNGLNYRWYRALFQGKYTALRRVQTAVNFLLILAVLGCAISGVLISQHLFSVGSGSTIEMGRHLHLVITAWAFVLMTVHLGLHWSIFAAIGRKISVSMRARRILQIVGGVLAVILCLYGLYQFVDRRFWEELFHRIDYQKEYDSSQSLPAYFAGTAALSAPFIAAAHYGRRLFVRTGRQGNGKKGEPLLESCEGKSTKAL